MLESRIDEVVVHARGAWVTRKVKVPAEAGPDLVISGITPLAEPGSVRAAVRGGRQVVSVHTALEVPSDRAEAGPTVSRLLELDSARWRLQAEWDLLERQRSALLATSIDPGLAARARTEMVGERTSDALAAAALIRELTRAADRRAIELTRAIEDLDREIAAARLADAQTSGKARMGRGHPTRSISVRLGGTGPIEDLTVSYTIAAARWWPLYTLRIESNAADWWLEALVAQRSAEDWEGVKLALSTSDLLADGRLPELPSLRLGRAQTAPRRGFRPPPLGLDAMFAGYDRVFAKIELEVKQSITVESTTRVALITEVDRVTLPKGGKDIPAPAKRRAIAPAAQSAPAGMPMQAGSGMMSGAMAKPGSFRGAPQNELAADEAAWGGGESAEPAPLEMEPAAIDLGEAWLDFDRLRLAPPSDHTRRGRLAPAAAGPIEHAIADARAAIEGLAPPEAVRDPLLERGSFDHRYEAGTRADVPADGTPHRLRLDTRSAVPRFRFRCAPREAPEVYREVLLDNPFDGPLLGGPVDVYIDGTLLLTAPLHATDRGGLLRVGLGVEDRVRVARNVVVKENTAGLLRGSISVEHQISIDLRSALGRSIELELLERAPVTDEEDLEIELLISDPKSESYSQEDRKTPIRGGRRWMVPLAAGEKRVVSWGYRLTLPGKNEIVGGNRRE